MWPKLKSMTDLTSEAVSIADDYFRPVGVVSVSALEVRPRLIADDRCGIADACTRIDSGHTAEGLNQMILANSCLWVVL